MTQIEQVRNNVLSFVRKQKAKPGHYHDGVYGAQAPNREVYIKKPNDAGEVAVTFYCGNQGFDFTFQPTEIQ